MTGGGEVVVATALPWEAAPLLRRLGGPRETAGEGFGVRGHWRGLALRVLVTGPGPDRVRRAAAQLRWEELRPPPRVLLSGGVAGALHPDLQPGDVVLADAVRNADPSAVPQTHAVDPGWRQRAQDALETVGLPWRGGLCLGVDTVLADAAAKRSAARESGAAVVQMEDHVWAEVAAAGQTPFLSLRVVLDARDQALPEAALDFPWQGSGAARVAATTLRRPRLALPLLRLAAHRRRACRAWGAFLEAFLTELSR